MATTQTTGKRRDWVLRIVLAAIIATGVLAALTGWQLASRDVIGIVPLGTESSVYVGPCTFEPLRLKGTCRAESVAQPEATDALTTASVHNGSAALRVCAVQHSAHNRGQCLTYWRKGSLRYVSPGLARDITGKRQAAYAHYGDTTYVFAANGRRYVS